jgi:hypothetical protein
MDISPLLFGLPVDRRREHLRRYVGARVALLCFDVYDFGVARAEVAQFMAYWSGIAFLVEELLPIVIG